MGILAVSLGVDDAAVDHSDRSGARAVRVLLEDVGRFHVAFFVQVLYLRVM